MSETGPVDDVRFVVRRAGTEEQHRVLIRRPLPVAGRWECVLEMTEFGRPKTMRGASEEQALFAARYVASGAYSALEKRTMLGGPFEWPWGPLPSPW